MSDAIKAEIHKLEDRRYRALIDSDFETLDKLLDDDLIYTPLERSVGYPGRVHWSVQKGRLPIPGN